MDNRYRVLARWGTRNIALYNRKVEKEPEDWTPEKALKYAPEGVARGPRTASSRKFPYIVVIDESLTS